MKSIEEEISPLIFGFARVNLNDAFGDKKLGTYPVVTEEGTLVGKVLVNVEKRSEEKLLGKF